MKVFGVARLTKDPELTQTKSGTKVCKFSVAHNEVRKNKETGEKIEETHFYDCVAWASGGETIAKYVGKGDQIMLEGSLKHDRWKDQETGASRSKHYIRVNEFTFVDGKRGNNSEPQFEQSKPVAEDGSEVPF